MYMISMETIKTLAQGALGSMTFGAYHMYVTKSMMEINNEMNDEKNKNMEIRNKIFMEQMKNENEELRKRFDKRWF
jgi:hypothetical protein